MQIPRAFTLLLGVVLVSCSATMPSEQSVIAPTPPPTTATQTQTGNERTVSIAPQAPIVLSVGETFSANSGRKWTVAFDDSILTLVEPQGESAASGWRFRARAAGETELTFTSAVIAECPNPPNCPSVPVQRIVLQVQVAQK